MRTRRMALFFSTALLIWTAINVYVFWRIFSLDIFSGAPRAVLVALAVFLWMSYVAGRSLARRVRILAAPLEWVGAHWLGVVFFLLIAFLGVDLLTGFGYLRPTLVPTLRAYAMAVALAMSILAVVQALRAPVVSDYEIPLAGLPAALEGTKVVVATDMHVGETVGASWLRRRVNQIQALRPDLIILGGDIVEGDNYGAELLENFRRLSARLGVYAVTGNHEFYAGVERSVRFLESAGIRVLRDQWEELQPGLVLAGVDDLTARRQFAEQGDFVRKALSGRPHPAATIFVSHTPWQAEEARDAGVGLMLSGHTHDGQIWPFRYLVKLQYPYVSGRYSVGPLTLIVCRGSGTWGPRMRLWKRSEILRITLRAG